MEKPRSQRIGPDGNPVSLVDSIEEAFLAQLSFECDWLIAAWNRLVGEVSEGDAAFGSRPLELSLSRWSYVDQVLLHLVRIDRILNPRPGRDSDESFRTRVEVAKRIARRPDLVLTQPLEVNRVRNWVEHLNEKLPDFFEANFFDASPPQALGPISVGPKAGPDAKLNFVPFAWVNTETWECGVLGESVNLKALVESVRSLRFALPRPGVTPHLVPRSPATGSSYQEDRP